MSNNTATLESTKLSGKYLTVFLDEESYGIAVLKVREIIRLQKVTPVPQVPHYVKGVINLRGRVIPVIDLRLKFGINAEVSDADDLFRSSDYSSPAGKTTVARDAIRITWCARVADEDRSGLSFNRSRDAAFQASRSECP